jgi:hypothetical protein
MEKKEKAGISPCLHPRVNDVILTVHVQHFKELKAPDVCVVLGDALDFQVCIHLIFVFVRCPSIVDVVGSVVSKESSHDVYLL